MGVYVGHLHVLNLDRLHLHTHSTFKLWTSSEYSELFVTCLFPNIKNLAPSPLNDGLSGSPRGPACLVGSSWGSSGCLFPLQYISICWETFEAK